MENSKTVEAKLFQNPKSLEEKFTENVRITGVENIWNMLKIFQRTMVEVLVWNFNRRGRQRPNRIVEYYSITSDNKELRLTSSSIY